jgi:glycerate dehydrogenase
MNIVVLDGYTLNPGDLSWKGLEALGNCTVYDRTPAPDIVSRAASAEIVLTNKTPLTRETLALLLAPVYRCRHGVQHRRRRRAGARIVVNVGYGTVSSQVLTHLLNLTHGIAHHRCGASGTVVVVSDSILGHAAFELSGKTMGIMDWDRLDAR